MVERCRNNIARDRSTSVEILQQSVQDTSIENATLVVLNFTLQFIPDDERHGILNKISAGLAPGGVLILAEKVQFDDAANKSR